MEEQKSKNNENQNQQTKKEDLENYNRAITLIQGQVQLFWLIFGAFLLSETVLLGAITSVDKVESGNLIFWRSIFGIILSLLWLTTSQYNHSFYILRISEAKAFEPRSGEFFTNGYKLHKGEKIKGIRIPWIARLLRPKVSLWILIVLYDIAFIYIAIQNCLSMHC